jgi:hypothetical protein
MNAIVKLVRTMWHTHWEQQNINNPQPLPQGKKELSHHFWPKLMAWGMNSKDNTIRGKKIMS